jgi:SPP1 gp7 family putative phage head morphogenesis protein
MMAWTMTPALMQAFDAAPRRVRRRVVIRPIGHSVAFEAALVVASREVIRRIDRECRADIIAAAIAQAGRLVKDAGGIAGKSPLGQALARLGEVADRIIAALAIRFERLFGEEGDRFDKKFIASFSAAIGDPIDLQRVIRKAGLDQRMATAAERHAALIKGLTAELEKRIASRIGDLMVAGASNKAIADVLVDEFGFGLRRAAFIARDQAAKFNGELNRYRQQGMGVTEFIWSTRRDTRVRGNPDGKYPNAKPSHWAREGKTYRWNDPPDGEWPGIPIGCRCVAKAVIEF